MAPFTLAFGAVSSYNVLALLAPALSAFACFGLVYFVTKSYFGSLFAGYIFGFSSYELGELLGHTTLDLTFIIPLLVLVFIARLQNKIRRNYFIALSSLLLVIQFGISNEVFATFYTFSILAILLFYSFGDSSLRTELLRPVKELAIATLISSVVLAPYLYYMATGYTSAPHIFNNPSLFSTDLANFILPTPVTHFGWTSFIHTTVKFSGNFSEDGAYVGIPLIIIGLYFVVRYWKRRFTKPLTILLLLLFLLTLGPQLHIAGKNTLIELPWAFALHIPLLKSALPDRFTMYISLVLAIIVGLWLSQKSTKRILVIKYAVTLLAIFFIIPNSAEYPWNTIKLPRVFNPTQVGKYIKRSSTVIILPYGYLGDDMYYQYSSGMYFNQAGGYLGYTPNDYSSDPVVKSFFSGIPERNFDKDLLGFCKKNGVSKIIYGPKTVRPIVQALDKLGWDMSKVDGMTILKVPGY